MGAKECQQCGTWMHSKVICLQGEGPKPSPILAMASTLGEEEEKYGRMFVGRTGQFLDRMLHEAGILRNDIYLTNAVKCRTIHPDTGIQRGPTSREIELCRSWLTDEIAEVQPKVILAMGTEAARSACDFTGSILAKRGRPVWSERYQCWVMLTGHPAYYARKQAEQEFFVWDLTKTKRLAYHGGFTPSPVNYRVVKTIDDLQEMREVILKHSEFAYDWETTGLHLTRAWGFCASFSVEPNTAWVVPRFSQNLRPAWEWEELDQVDDVLRDLLLSDLEKFGSNVGFDNNMSKNTLGIWPRNVTFCCMTAHHLWKNHLGPRAHGLKVMADLYTDMGLYDEELDDWLTKNRTPHEFYRAPNDMLWKYSGADADATLRLARYFRAELAKPIVNPHTRVTYALLPLMQQERMPALLDLQDEDRAGVRIDVASVDTLSTELGSTLSSIEKEIETMMGEPVNPASFLQTGELLFKKLQLPVYGRTDKGQPSTKSEFLEPIKDLHPVVDLILEHRAYTKIKGTYVDGKEGDGALKAAVDSDHRARVNTQLTVTETFRLSTQKPFPIHTWPRNKKGRPSVRKLIIADDNHSLIIADYQQQEYCIMAVAANQSDMVEALLQRREDAHEWTMSWLFGKQKSDFEAPDGSALYDGAHEDFKNLRANTKNTNFGIMYREGARKLAKALGMQEHEAAAVIEKWYQRMYKVREWQNQQINVLRQTGYSYGLFGTRRFLPSILDPDVWVQYEAERATCNFPIQNAGAHMMIRAKTRINHRLRELYMPASIIGWDSLPDLEVYLKYRPSLSGCEAIPIVPEDPTELVNHPARVYFSQHDSIVIHARDDLVEDVTAMVREEMQRPVPELDGHFCYADIIVRKHWE